MFADHLKTALVLALLAPACSATPAAHDAGVDLGYDLGIDASADDAGEDASTDSAVIGPDYGPAPVRFVPRLLFADPSVHCGPVPAPSMRPHPGPRPARGTVRWTYNPSRDPATRAAPLFGGGLGLTGRSLLGMANGGFVTSINLSSKYLGVNADGTFGFFVGAAGDNAEPSWMMPNTFINRPTVASGFGGGVLWFRDTSDWSAGAFVGTAVVSPGPPARTTGAVEFSVPAVLADGTVLFFPTDRTMMAVCTDGRPRWVLEFDSAGFVPSVFAAGDGRIVLAGTNVGFHRLDPDGHVVASRPMGERVAILGYSDRCGVAAQSTMPLPLTYFGGEDFSTIKEIAGGERPTADCGWWRESARTGAPTRYRPDGRVGFESTARQPDLARIELADGSWLLISNGGSIPPGMTVVSDEGAIVFDTSFDPTSVGERLSQGAYLLTPDGVLYVTATSGDETVQQFAAIEVGIGPDPSWAGRRGLGWVGTSWANDMATWH